MRKYEVYRGGLKIDVVYNTEAPAKEVRDSLIDHDGYPTDISVYRCAQGRHAFDDVARATHPEEI